MNSSMTSVECEAKTLTSILSNISRKEMDCTLRIQSNHASIFSGISREDRDIARSILGLSRLVDSDEITVLDRFFELLTSEAMLFGADYQKVNRGVGAFMGMVLGDYLGAPVEFTDAINDSVTIRLSDALEDGVEYSLMRNPFQLKLGQWTDDASMGACIADSLLVKHKFSGRDVRSRFWNWWVVGYNNAFSYSPGRSPYTSVGLGGNIAKSIAAINGKSYCELPHKYIPTIPVDDSGNGGLMRLAAVPVFFSAQPVEIAIQAASLSSETTHPGHQASRAAEYMSYLIHMAINRDESRDWNGLDSECYNGLTDAQKFLSFCATTYLHNHLLDSIPGSDKLKKLLLSNEPQDSKEVNWNWKSSQRLDINRCMRNRGEEYNGYSNTASYFGSYCMDGLAIALNSVYNSSDLSSTLEYCINYRGDSDSTASIAGQIAGAFYGIAGIDRKLINHALKWDRGDQIFRAVMLTPWFQAAAGLDHLVSSEESILQERCQDDLPDMKAFKEVVIDSAATILDLNTSSSRTSLGSAFGWISGLLFPSSGTPAAINSAPVSDGDLRDDFLEAAYSGNLPAFRTSLELMRDRFTKGYALRTRTGAESNQDINFFGEWFSCVDANGRTCLHLAAASGHSSIVEIIINSIQQTSMDDVSTNTDNKKSLLHFVDKLDNAQHSAFQLALCNDFDKIAEEMLRILNSSIRIGSYVKSRNSVFLMCTKGLSSLVNLVIERFGVDEFRELAMEVDSIGLNALHSAALYGRTDICRLLLSLGLPVDAVARDGSSPLHFASRKAVSSEALDVLSQYCSEHAIHAIGLMDSFGSTALHVAAMYANIDAVRIIVKRFPTSLLMVQDNDGLYPTHVACQKFSQLTLQFEQEPNEQPVLAVEIQKSIACILEILSSGYPLDLLDFSDSNIFHTLCWNCSSQFHLDLIKNIIEFFCGEEASAVSKTISADNIDNDSVFAQTMMLESSHGWSCLHVILNTAKDTSNKAPAGQIFELLWSHTPQAYRNQFNGQKVKIASNLFIQRRGPHKRLPLQQRQAVLDKNYSLSGIAQYLLSFQHKFERLPRVVALVGAGMSTSCGIKDFRSSDGVYANKATANVFSTECLTNDPRLFYGTMRELFLPVIDKKYRPSVAHAFLKLLKDCGWLSQVFTQNIDMLEYAAGLLESDVFECHGSCRAVKCMNPSCAYKLSSTMQSLSKCGTAGVTGPSQFASDSDEEMDSVFWSKIRNAELLPFCPFCGSSLRPEVIFFGESMPPTFDKIAQQYLSQCDLLLVMGTTLSVYPVAGLPNLAPPYCPRLLINREATGCFQFVNPCNQSIAEGISSIPMGRHAMANKEVWETSNYRDVFYGGDCDIGARSLALELGMSLQLDDIISTFSS